MADLYRRKPEIESAPIERECILYSPGADRFLHLNSTASFVWSRIGEPATAESVAGALASSFEGVQRSDALRDVESLLEELVSLSVVEVLPGPVSGPVDDGPVPRENG